MKYNYFEPGNIFYLNGLNLGTTSVGLRNNAVVVKCRNPIAGIALKAQIEKLVDNKPISLDAIKVALESISDREMKVKLANGTIHDIKRSMVHSSTGKTGSV